MTFEEYIDKSIREFKKRTIQDEIEELEHLIEDDERAIEKCWKLDSERACFLYKAMLERKQRLEWMQSLRRLSCKEQVYTEHIASLTDELQRYRGALNSACAYEQQHLCEECKNPNCDKDCKDNAIKHRVEFYLGG